VTVDTLHQICEQSPRQMNCDGG